MKTKKEIREAIKSIRKGEGLLTWITGNDRVDEHEIVTSVLEWVLGDEK